MEFPKKTPRPVLYWALFSLWLMAFGAGAGVLGAYASRAGEVSETPAVWPIGLGLDRLFDDGPARHAPAYPGVWTVVMAAHPECPCTRASIQELRYALAHASEPYRLFVLAYEPEHMPGFASTPAMASLAEREHTRVVIDTDGAIAQRLGGVTSGFVSVYDRGGRLRFAGGVTPTRSHTGPNTGSASVRALLSGDDPPAPAAPVYGCPIRTDTQTPKTYSSPLGSCTTGGAPPCQP